MSRGWERRTVRWSMEGRTEWQAWCRGPLALLRWHGEWVLLHRASELVLAGHGWPTLAAAQRAVETVVELDVWGFTRDQAIRAQDAGHTLIQPEVSALLRANR